MSTLFEKIGGADAVDAAVEKFYAKVLADDRIKHFFEGVDMDRQRPPIIRGVICDPKLCDRMCIMEV